MRTAPSHGKGFRSPVLLPLALFFLALLQGCADIPRQMRVDDGSTPKYQDQDVRFRTTYYFRVFDVCKQGNKNLTSPQTDALYRFVMTGKANAYANKVRFESGTLKASQIDPFGATIGRNSEGDLYYVPQAVSEARMERDFTREQIDDLIELRNELTERGKPEDETAENANKTLIDGIDERIKTLISEGYAIVSPVVPEAEDKGNPDKEPDVTATDAGNGNEAGADDGNDAAADDGNTQDDDNGQDDNDRNRQIAGTGKCPQNSQLTRGFQLMGPEGIQTFNQEDRLIMAMSSSAKPLINSLQALSGRMLQARQQEETSLTEAEMLLPLVREQLKVSELRRALLELQGLGGDAEQQEVGEKLEGLSAILEPDDISTEADSPMNEVSSALSGGNQ